MTTPTPEDHAAYSEAAHLAGEWSRSWMFRLADASTVVNDGVRFTPGVLRELHSELLKLDHNATRTLLLAALFNGAAMLNEEIR